MTAGKFITIEGGEGVGKSTQIGRLRDFIARQGIEVLVTREPGGTRRAERIRELRASARNAAAGTSDRFEQERRDFVERVRAAYLERARQEPERIVVVDATQSMDAVTAGIQQALGERLLKWSATLRS